MQENSVAFKQYYENIAVTPHAYLQRNERLIQIIQRMLNRTYLYHAALGISSGTLNSFDSPF